MESDLCLINVGTYSEARSYGKMLHEPTMALYVLSDYLKNNGFVVEVVDGAFRELKSSSILSVAMSSRIVGFYSICAGMDSIDAFSTQIKQKMPSKIIISGGPAALAHDDILRNYPGIDIVIPDGFEGILKDILNETKKNQNVNLLEFDGIHFRRGSELFSTNLLTRHRLPAKVAKVEYTLRATGTRILKIIGSQGCTNKCKFCVASNFRSLCTEDEFVTEILEGWKHGIHTFYIADENFCPPKYFDRAINICKKIKKGLGSSLQDITIKVFLEPRAPYEILSELGSIGKITAFIGFESFSDKTLRFFGKPTSRDRNIHFWDEAIKLGINVIPGIISLHPFLSPEELEDLIIVADKYDSLSFRFLSKKLELYPGAALVEIMNRKYPHLLEDGFSPLKNPAEWKYAYDLEKGKPILKGIENTFTKIATRQVVNEVYSLMFDINILTGGKFDPYDEAFLELRTRISHKTRQMATNLITIFLNALGEDGNHSVEILIKQYEKELNEILPKVRSIFSNLVKSSKP